METEQKKFWRVLFVVDEGSTEQSMGRWLNVIQRYAESITLVSLGDITAADLMELPADALVVDGRAQDLDGIGILVTLAGSRLLPSLTLYGSHWSDDDIGTLRNRVAGTTLYPYAEDDFETTLEDFLHRTEPFDHSKERRERPWVARPRTVTLEQMRVAQQRYGPPLHVQ